MYSSEDVERFYLQCQTEAVLHRVSLQSFCSKNNVPYNIFHNGTRIPAERVEIAAVYHSIISMVKLQARSAWDYYGEFFTGIFNSCRDFLSLAYANS